jgi:hypothetical protein
MGDTAYAPVAQRAARPAGTRGRWFDWNNRVGSNY